MRTMSISKFKATCLAVLEQVRTTGEPVVVTKRGVPVAEVVPPSVTEGDGRELGTMAHTATIIGDLVEPVSDESDWEALTR